MGKLYDISVILKQKSTFVIIVFLCIISSIGAGFSLHHFYFSKPTAKKLLYKIDKMNEKITELDEQQKPNNNLTKEVEKLKNGFNQINDKIKGLETAKKEEIKKLDPKNSLEKDDQRSQTKSNTNNTNFPKTDLTKMPSFDKLIGFKDERAAADRFLTFLKNVKKIPNVGEVKIPTGILLHGVAGTGKTTFAQALAKEANLPFFNTSASQFSKGVVGEAPQMVRDLFTTARREAQKSGGAIIFIDECEEIFKDLTDNQSKTTADTVNIINEFKAQMTSFENDPKKPVFLMGATNHINKIDEAIKSRFSYMIEIKPGNFEERQQMFEFLINKRKNPYSPEAKDYLLNVVNRALDELPSYKQANRILTGILDEAVATFVLENEDTTPPRTQININDIKTAYRLRVDKDTGLLDIKEINFINEKIKSIKGNKEPNQTQTAEMNKLKSRLTELNNDRETLEKDYSLSEKQSNANNANFPKTDLTKMPSFDKLIGFKDEREASNRFLTFLKNVENIPNVGEVKIPTGILLHGVAGTGKTTFAQALAKEANLPFFNTSASQFSKGVVGEAPQMVRDLFATARKEAQRSGGAIIFIDECEEIFKDLTDNQSKTTADTVNIINEFKAQMTSFENDPKKPVFLMGATNHINKIDEAIKSRFSYMIEIKPGNFEERQQMFEFLINKRKNPYSPEAKDYLLNVVNRALDELPSYKQANRILTGILDEAVATFVLENEDTTPPRTQINIDDIKTAYRLRVDKDIRLLDFIDNFRKQQQETPK
jgi:cell division protease FtsH